MADLFPSETVAIVSMGCRTNQEEMDALSSSLLEEGYRLTDKPHEASIIIVNTCSVTGSTESKTLRILRSLVSRAPRCRMLVTGCLAQQKPHEIIKMDGVWWVVGNGCKDEISDILKLHSKGIYLRPLVNSTEKKLSINRKILNPEASPVLRTRYSVKLQEGCDFRCSYCIVPLLRGPSRSASFVKIVDIIKNAVEKGYKEIVLTGTHIGQFNDRGHRLIDLIDELTQIDGDFRIRLSSLDPVDCSDEILDRIGKDGKICNHLHVSLQSCSEKVLKAMNRHVSETILCIEKLEEFRKKFPLAGLGADIIVGFPGETEEMFEETCRRLEKIGLSYAHIFRYSRRPGTNASELQNQVRESVKKSRGRRIAEIVGKSRRLFISRVKGSVQRIIVESRSPVRGLTSNYLRIEIPDFTFNYNSWLYVSVTEKSAGRYCMAQPLLYKAN